MLVVVTMFGTIVWAAAGILVGLFVFRVGLGMIRSLATPLPPPPPAGEMRRVKIQYRCSICGTEVRMTLASDELPDPPRHCQEDMDLVAPDRVVTRRRSSRGREVTTV